MQRRALLAALGGMTAIAGCTSVGYAPGTGTGTGEPDDGTSEGSDLPEECPTSQNLGVEWPDDLDAASARAFVEEYEHAYYRDVVVEYEPESRFDAYELSGGVSGRAQKAGDGWMLEYTGDGGVYRPDLLLTATVSETPPEGADIVSVDDIEYLALVEAVENAVEEGEDSLDARSADGGIDPYADHLAALSDDFDRLQNRGDGDSVFVDVDGTVYELTVHVTMLHGDYWWGARYYVDERVVWRTKDEEKDPRSGKLLECRRRE